VIDLHCHLLPAVDDGPASIEESIAMGRAAYADGVRTIVVTPHARDWRRAHPGEKAGATLPGQVRALQEALHQAGVPLALHPGMEEELDLDLPQRLEDGRAVPLGRGPYFLLELPFMQYPLYLDEVLFQAQVQGWRPLLAHPERYRYVQASPDVLAPLVQRGVLVQVSVGSLAGEGGPRDREVAQWLLRRGLVHCLASDGHSAAGARRALLTPGVQAAARIIGPARAHALVTEIPERIVAGETLKL